MQRSIWIVVSVMISTGVYFTIRYGLRPKAIPVLNATQFEDPQQVGAVIYRRLRQEIRAERVLLLGSTPELQDYEKVWEGLIKTALADHVNIPVLFQREGLLSPLETGTAIEVIPFVEGALQSGELVQSIKNKLAAGKLVLVQDASSEVSHLMRASLSRALDVALGHPVLSLSTLALSLKPEEQDSLQTQCLGGTDPVEARLECAELRVSKILLKKKSNPEKTWAVMERHGLKEYLVFIHR